MRKIQWKYIPNVPADMVCLNRIALLCSIIILKNKDYDRETLVKPDTFQNYVNKYQKICYEIKETDDFKRYFVLNQTGIREFVGDDFLITPPKKAITEFRKKILGVFLEYGNLQKNWMTTIMRFLFIPGLILLPIGAAIYCKTTSPYSFIAFIAFAPFLYWMIFKVLIQFTRFQLFYYISTDSCMISFVDEFETLERLNAEKEDEVTVATEKVVKDNGSELADVQSIVNKDKISLKEINDEEYKRNKLLQIFDKYSGSSIQAKELKNLKKLCVENIDFAINIYNFLNIEDDIKNKLSGSDIACFYASQIVLFFPKIKGKQQGVIEFYNICKYMNINNITTDAVSTTYPNYKKNKIPPSTHNKLIMETLSKMS